MERSCDESSTHTDCCSAEPKCAYCRPARLWCTPHHLADGPLEGATHCASDDGHALAVRSLPCGELPRDRLVDLMPISSRSIATATSDQVAQTAGTAASQHHPANLR